MEYTYTNDQGYPHHVCDVEGNHISQSSHTTSTTQNPASPQLESNEFTNWRSLGKGNCGSVWTTDNSSWAIKREDCSKTRFLWKEYYIQNRIHTALSHTSDKILVPFSYWNTSKQELWYLPSSELENCNVMRSERIPPLSAGFRNRSLDAAVPRHAEEAKRIHLV
ncbi:hypothetical protein AUEXF2481DRAFT_474920 [Aureobasidium subglaciale EXF-2481]|uniref:Protein kinase domain-containing protein n=1 Tax=Aureobasidium subglaciale (strain EXF-2481) TaxID=1043005 RepID=A0A074YKM6_AURSE|nr:uncharacterized protein AUEXF2481DRAFT_474920 [Aureobasidium subglaciale EXF-2481]KEQ98235.1 hypothetical protein AUEXF2481DRAFT_474920 [Aureobasidium subglaciale EXF-2481]